MDSRNDQALEGAEQPDHAYLVNGTLPDEMIEYIGSYLPNIKDLSSFNQTSWRTHAIFKQPLNEFAYKRLVQAVIDDDRRTVKKILDSHPSLVLFTPSKGIVIESQLTWQRFYLEEDIVTIAVKRKQLKMIRLLLGYCDNLEQTEGVKAAREKALSAWNFYSISEMQKHWQIKETIHIPQSYADYAQKLIDVFKKEKFLDDRLSHETQAVLFSLYYKLLPTKAMTLDQYPDTERLLLAVYKAYAANFETFDQNLKHKQRDVFCISVVGLIQSVLAPETAKIFCEGLDDVASNDEKGIETEMSKAAIEHILKSGLSYYRSSRDSFDGLGFKFFVGLFGMDWSSAQHIGSQSSRRPCETAFLSFDQRCLAKEASFRNFTRHSTPLREQHSINHKQPRCVIS